MAARPPPDDQSEQVRTLDWHDSNAHSALYGPCNNARGDQLEDLVLQHGLTIDNEGNTPTFKTRRGDRLIRTFIDVTLTRDILGLSKWRVDRTFNASDHNNIFFEVASPGTDKITLRPWSKADWPMFTQHLATTKYDFPATMSMKKFDKISCRLYNDLEAALDKACPRITITEKTQKSHWATEEHALVKQQVSKLYSIAKSSNRTKDWTDYKKATKAFKRMCNRDKNRAWGQYKEGLLSTKEVARFVKLSQRSESSNINTLVRQDDSSMAPGKETIDLLTSTHFLAATNIKHITYNNRRNLAMSEINNKYQDWITIPLVHRALLGF